MALQIRSEGNLIPKYSLTGDLLSFLRCRLQYRYHNGSSLPPSRPVQLWFGEFIHGIMEGAYRIWREASSTIRPEFPWPMHITLYGESAPSNRSLHDIGTIGDIVEATLRSQGKIPRSSVVRESAYKRAERAVNELGPDLFPLIASAEERVIGTRSIPNIQGVNVRAHKYELDGIIDVVTDLELNGAPTSNIFKQALQHTIPELSGRFEVILDYKGSRRPSINHDYWQQAEWQVQTYAWLRTRQSGSLTVAAGVLLYINELAPTSEDLKSLKREMARQETDVMPERGSPDYYAINTWQPGAAIPSLSFAFRLARALRVIPIDHNTQITATTNFDEVVREIECCIDAEARHGEIIGNWESRGDEETCAACDFRYFCPSQTPLNDPTQIVAPGAP